MEKWFQIVVAVWAALGMLAMLRWGTMRRRDVCQPLRKRLHEMEAANEALTTERGRLQEDVEKLEKNVKFWNSEASNAKERLSNQTLDKVKIEREAIAYRKLVETTLRDAYRRVTGILVDEFGKLGVGVSEKTTPPKSELNYRGTLRHVKNHGYGKNSYEYTVSDEGAEPQLGDLTNNLEVIYAIDRNTNTLWAMCASDRPKQCSNTA